VFAAWLRHNAIFARLLLVLKRFSTLWVKLTHFSLQRSDNKKLGPTRVTDKCDENSMGLQPFKDAL
jgi:hypothetical protein